MAEINQLGQIRARCPGCKGALTSFEWRTEQQAFGAVHLAPYNHMGHQGRYEDRLYRCAGCNRGGLARVRFVGQAYPGTGIELRAFHPEVQESLKLPESVPPGIQTEFREAEACMSADCYRAAAGMFRSVLDKTLRANGYKLKPGTTLQQQIDMAADDGIITAARQRRAHDEIRVLGNDVLHDEWTAIPSIDVEASHHYVQRVLEDFYDDRASTLKVLLDKGRTPDDAPKTQQLG